MQNTGFTWVDYFFVFLDAVSLPVFSLLAVLLVVWLLGHRRGPFQRCFYAAEKAFVRFARSTPLPISYCLCFFAGFGVSLFLFLFARRPYPYIHDELAYMLASDTFRSGRLTNPTPAHYQHFESLALILKPSYMGKYPPGQGLMLALGQLLGDPVVGLWINAGLVCAAAFWMLQAFTRRDNALLWSLLVSLHPAVVKWAQIFWGGNVALLGGILVLGAVRRIVNDAHEYPTVAQSPSCTGNAVMLGVGLSVLAISRPFEGAVAAVIGCSPLLSLLPPWKPEARYTFDRHLWRCFMVPLVAVVSSTLVFIGIYNRAVTGNPLTMPYVIHEEHYAPVPNFLWQEVRDGHTLPTLMRQDPNQFVMSYASVRFYASEKGTMANIWSGVVEKYTILSRSAFQMFDPWVYELDPGRRQMDVPTRLASAAVILLLPGFVAAWFSRHGKSRDRAVLDPPRWHRWGTGALIAFFVLLLQETYMNPHYGAPAGALVILLWVQSWRHLRAVRLPHFRTPFSVGTRRWGLSLSRFFVLICFASFIRCFFALASPEARNVGKKPFVINFLKSGDNSIRKHLVLVYYGPRNTRFPIEWVYNSSNIEAQDIIWARYLKPEQNEALLADDRYGKNRQVWLLWVDHDATMRLYKYDPARFANLPPPPPQVYPADIAERIMRGGSQQEAREMLAQREKIAEAKRVGEIDSALRLLTATPPVIPPMTHKP